MPHSHFVFYCCVIGFFIVAWIITMVFIKKEEENKNEKPIIEENINKNPVPENHGLLFALFADSVYYLKFLFGIGALICLAKTYFILAVFFFIIWLFLVFINAQNKIYIEDKEN